MGHAGYARKGKPDIICAAVSALIINCVNALEDLAKEDVTTTQNSETGFMRIVFNKALQDKSVFLVDSTVYSLKKISEEYGDKYLIVKIKEV